MLPLGARKPHDCGAARRFSHAHPFKVDGRCGADQRGGQFGADVTRHCFGRRIDAVDWQMNTNYPVVRLERTSGIYYTRTFDWNNTGVQTGTLITTTSMTVPSNIPFGSYNLRVTANGIASLPWTFWNPNPICLSDVNIDGVVGQTPQLARSDERSNPSIVPSPLICGHLLQIPWRNVE